MIIAITGHRPDKLGGYKPCAEHEHIRLLMKKAFMAFQPTQIITGMALGVDQWAAEEALKLKIPLVAAIPFEEQASNWPHESQQHYRNLLSQIPDQIRVCEPGYLVWKLQKRNEWMVDHCDMVLAFWDGTKGGTANCVNYAVKKKKTVMQINPHIGVDLWCTWLHISEEPYRESINLRGS